MLLCCPLALALFSNAQFDYLRLFVKELSSIEHFVFSSHFSNFLLSESTLIISDSFAFRSVSW